VRKECDSVLEQLNVPINTKWTQNGVTVAGGNGEGEQLNQFYYPWGFDVDDEQTIYVADTFNHRIVEWKKGATSGRVVAGGKGKGNRNDQLYCPKKVIIDKNNDFLIISDEGNDRVVRWPRRNGTHGEIIVSNVVCWGLAIDNNGDLYVPDREKHEVRRWKIGEKSGTIVAGGNGKGDRLNQLNSPCYIFVDQDQSVYGSNGGNHRVMKWMKGAKEGVVVAGGQGKGNSLTQLSHPNGIIVDQLGTVYVVDEGNNRVMRWLKGAKEGRVVVGGNGKGDEANQLNYPVDLAFDLENNLYVLDQNNSRVQKFSASSVN
jgi:sugar lactone lactonase YvrE